VKAVVRLPAVAILVAALGFVGLTYVRVHEHCVAGLEGASVSVAVDGPGANDQCQSFVGQVTDGGSWYVYQSGTEPGGAVLCQYSYLGDTFSVRDQGIADVYGSQARELLYAKVSGLPAPTAGLPAQVIVPQASQPAADLQVGVCFDVPTIASGSDTVDTAQHHPCT
jgi:hypothetical protein